MMIFKLTSKSTQSHAGPSASSYAECVNSAIPTTQQGKGGSVRACAAVLCADVCCGYHQPCNGRNQLHLSSASQLCISALYQMYLSSVSTASQLCRSVDCPTCREAMSTVG
eukprot:333119-Chlamydomonas_euryale.AAC.1